MPQIKLKHKLALNPKSCAWCTVRPNKLKGQSLKQRKVNCKDQTRSMGGLCSKDPNFLMVFREECLKAKFGVRAAGCRTYFWLVGGEVTGWCSRNNVFSLKLVSSALVGIIVPVRKTPRYIVTYIPLGGNTTLYLWAIVYYFWLLWTFVAVCGLSLVVVSEGYPLAAMHWLLIVMASLVAEHGL